MDLLQFSALQITIGEHLVCRNLDLRLGAGERLGMLGRNGVGKTTLLHTIMGFHKQDAGSVLLNGSPQGSRSRRQLARQVGLLFQESENSMPATVLETVLLGRHPYSDNFLMDSAEDLSMARDALEQVGLESLADRQVGTLSGGEKQRLAIALLLLQNPRLLLLDEPSNHLDIDNQIQVFN